MSLKRKREIEDYKKNEYIISNNISVEEVVMNPELMPSTWVNTTQKRKRIEKKRREIEKERRGGRFWRPLTFYFCGFGSEIIRELFGNELYDKSDMKKNGSTWWNGYEGQDIVLL